MSTLILKKSVSHRIKEGHLWIYAADVKKIRGGPRDGDVVTVQDDKTRFLGQGIINQKSQIICRLFTRDREDIDRTFLGRRIETAWAYRQNIVRNSDAFRIIYSEADGLPGLIVDKYDHTLVVQFLTLGMENRKQDILQILSDLIKPQAIFQRNDVKVREYEGLTQEKGWLTDTMDSLIKINEHDINYWVDITAGQKTGFYLDQRENRAVIQIYLIPDARVLDAFCYTGGFSMAAAKYGAKEVIGLDSSQEAINLAKENARLNNVENNCIFKMVNAFDELRRMADNKEQFDLIILDPPAFTKSKASVSSAFRGYKEINLRAMKLLSPGGVLLTCSCSQHISAEMFYRILLEASKDVGKTIRIIEKRTQAKDHPILLGMPETEYLKCWILKVI